VGGWQQKLGPGQQKQDPHSLNAYCNLSRALLCLNPRPHLQEILNGGVDICREAGIPLAGGHSIDSPEPIFGLVVTGVVDPQLVKRNSAAQVRTFECVAVPVLQISH
jgi:selenophosphate synthase